MKILFVTEFFSSNVTTMSGGVEARAHHIITRIKKRGVPISVISRKRSHITATAFSIFPRLWFLLSSIVQGSRIKADIVEGSNFVTYIPAFILATIHKASAVAWFADVYGKTWFNTMSLPVALAGYVFEWLSLRLPWKTVIAMSQATKVKLIRAGIPSHKIVVIYGGVDCQIIDTIIVNKYDKPTICTAARLVPYKCIDDLIRAVALIQTTQPHVELVIMGDGPEKESLIELSNTITLRNSVRFLGSLPQEEVWRVMKQSHVFSLPSVVEGFGLVTIEAMACGIPYVNADIPPTREITEGGKGGYLYPPRNVEHLAKALLKALDNYSSNNNQRYAKRYSWERIIDQTLAAYQL